MSVKIILPLAAVFASSGVAVKVSGDTVTEQQTSWWSRWFRRGDKQTDKTLDNSITVDHPKWEDKTLDNSITVDHPKWDGNRARTESVWEPIGKEWEPTRDPFARSFDSSSSSPVIRTKEYLNKSIDSTTQFTSKQTRGQGRTSQSSGSLSLPAPSLSPTPPSVGSFSSQEYLIPESTKSSDADDRSQYDEDVWDLNPTFSFFDDRDDWVMMRGQVENYDDKVKHFESLLGIWNRIHKGGEEIDEEDANNLKNNFQDAANFLEELKAAYEKQVVNHTTTTTDHVGAEHLLSGVKSKIDHMEEVLTSSSQQLAAKLAAKLIMQDVQDYLENFEDEVQKLEDNLENFEDKVKKFEHGTVSNYSPEGIEKIVKNFKLSMKENLKRQEKLLADAIIYLNEQKAKCGESALECLQIDEAITGVQSSLLAVQVPKYVKTTIAWLRETREEIDREYVVENSEIYLQTVLVNLETMLKTSKEYEVQLKDCPQDFVEIKLDLKNLIQSQKQLKYEIEFSLLMDNFMVQQETLLLAHSSHSRSEDWRILIENILTELESFNEYLQHDRDELLLWADEIHVKNLTALQDKVLRKITSLKQDLDKRVKDQNFVPITSDFIKDRKHYEESKQKMLQEYLSLVEDLSISNAQEVFLKFDNLTERQNDLFDGYHTNLKQLADRVSPLVDNINDEKVFDLAKKIEERMESLKKDVKSFEKRRETIANLKQRIETERVRISENNLQENAAIKIQSTRRMNMAQRETHGLREEKVRKQLAENSVTDIIEKAKQTIQDQLKQEAEVANLKKISETKLDIEQNEQMLAKNKPLHDAIKAKKVAQQFVPQMIQEASQNVQDKIKKDADIKTLQENTKKHKELLQLEAEKQRLVKEKQSTVQKVTIAETTHRLNATLPNGTRGLVRENNRNGTVQVLPIDMLTLHEKDEEIQAVQAKIDGLDAELNSYPEHKKKFTVEAKPVEVLYQDMIWKERLEANRKFIENLNPKKQQKQNDKSMWEKFQNWNKWDNVNRWAANPVEETKRYFLDTNEWPRETRN